MKKYLSLILLCVLALSFASCEDDDQYDIESVIIGRSWTGDVGMAADGSSLFSTFTFGADGFGEEIQYYSDGFLYHEYRFQWWWEDGYSRNLVLDYGREGISYMDDVRVSGNQMWGTFYLSDGDRGFYFVLYME